MFVATAEGRRKVARSWERSVSYDNFWMGATPTYYPLGLVGNATALGAVTLATNQLFMSLFCAPNRDVTIDSLMFEVTTLIAASNAVVGIYETNDDLRNPIQGLLLGEMSASTASTGVKTGAVSIPLKRGRLYMAAMQVSAAIGVRGVVVGGQNGVLTDGGTNVFALGAFNHPSPPAYSGALPKLARRPLFASYAPRPMFDNLFNVQTNPLIAGRVSA